MKRLLPTEMLEATRLTVSGRLSDATAALRRLLSGRSPAASSAPPAEAYHGPTIDGIAEPAPAPHPAPPDPAPGPARTTAPAAGQFLQSSFTNAAGTRPYKLFIPSRYHGQALPLIVMLHGCTQSADDFAAGTRMNEAAEAQDCFVVYPEQVPGANAQKCWNWFNTRDQVHGAGEPSLIAGITQQVMREYGLDARRVYVAGLSAGGAAASVLGATYPDLFAAIGVHSGLPCGAAHDVPSAFAAMQRGPQTSSQTAAQHVPTIVFHGDRDMTVNKLNGDAVVAQAGSGAALKPRTEHGQAPGGYPFDRIIYSDAAGRAMIEQWVVHGAGHAWFGGSLAGTYTDPRGPDATAEMLRFFLQHPHPAPK